MFMKQLNFYLLMVVVISYSARAQQTATLPTTMPTTMEPTTMEPTTMEPTTMEPTTMEPTTMEPTTMEPTTMEPTTMEPTTMEPTTMEPTTMEPTTMEPTTMEPTTMEPTTMEPTTMEPTTMEPTTMEPTMEPTTMEPTTMEPTTMPTEPSGREPGSTPRINTATADTTDEADEDDTEDQDRTPTSTDMAMTEGIPTQTPTTGEQRPETIQSPPSSTRTPTQRPPPPRTPTVFNIQISAGGGAQINLNVTAQQEQRENSISIIFTFETEGTPANGATYVMRCEATIGTQRDVHIRRLADFVSVATIERLQGSQRYTFSVRVDNEEAITNIRMRGMREDFTIDTIAITRSSICLNAAIAIMTVAVILFVVMVIAWVILCIVLCKKRSKNQSFSPSKYDTTNNIRPHSHTPITQRPLPSPQHNTEGQTYETIPGSTYEYIVAGSVATETVLSSESRESHCYHVLEKTVPEKSKTISNVSNQVSNTDTDNTVSHDVENSSHTYNTLEDRSIEQKLGDSQLTEDNGSQGVTIVVPPQEPLEYELPSNALRQNVAYTDRTITIQGESIVQKESKENETKDKGGQEVEIMVPSQVALEYELPSNTMRETYTTTVSTVVGNAGHTSTTIQDKSIEQNLSECKHSEEISTDSQSKEGRGGCNESSSSY